MAMTKKRKRLISGLAVAFLIFLCAAELGLGPLDAHLTNQILFHTGTAMVFLGIPAVNIFPICYAKWFPWWSGTLGRALMMHAFGMALLVDFAVLYNVFGDDYPFRELVRTIVFALVIGGMWYYLIAIIQIRREGKAAAAQAELEAARHSL